MSSFLCLLLLTGTSKGDNWLVATSANSIEWCPTSPATYSELKVRAERENKRLIVFVNNIASVGYTPANNDLIFHASEFPWGTTVDHGPSVIISECRNGTLMHVTTIKPGVVSRTLPPSCKCQTCICPTCPGDCPAEQTDPLVTYKAPIAVQVPQGIVHLKSEPVTYYAAAPTCANGNCNAATNYVPNTGTTYLAPSSTGGSCSSGNCPSATYSKGFRR